MKSTGEVMGVGPNFPAAFAKASWGAGDRLPLEGTVFISVADAEKDAVILMALIFSTLGFKILATEGTHRALRLNGIESELVMKHTVGMEMRALLEAGNDAEGATASAPATGAAGGPIVTVVDLIEAGDVDLVINIPRGRGARADGYEIRRAALRERVPTMTNAAAAHAAVQAIASARRSREVTVSCLQDLHDHLSSAYERR
jgi:carbamoyl-phosphate synthase large subunit